MRDVPKQMNEWETNIIKHDAKSDTYPAPEILFEHGRRSMFPVQRFVPGAQIMSHDVIKRQSLPVQANAGEYHIISMDDITTTSGADQEHVYVLSSRCKKLHIVVKKKFDGNVCHPLDSAQDALAKEFSFASQGGVKVTTYAGYVDTI